MFVAGAPAFLGPGGSSKKRNNKHKTACLAKRSFRCILSSRMGCCRAMFDANMQRNALFAKNTVFVSLFFSILGELSPGPKKPEPPPRTYMRLTNRP